jgi:hypothetical protein
MAYSVDLREKVLDYRKNHNLEQTYNTFKVSKTTILDREKLQKETGNLEKRPLNRTFKKIDPVKLAEFIFEKPDSFFA